MHDGSIFYRGKSTASAGAWIWLYAKEHAKNDKKMAQLDNYFQLLYEYARKHQ